jgi:ADP-heptose:LPS heptosyltransferase
MDPEVIAIIRLDGLGDYVLTTPLISALREQHARPAVIVAVVSPIGSQLATEDSRLDRVIVAGSISGRGGTMGGQSNAFTRAVWALAAGLRLARLRPTMAILPRADVDSWHALGIAALSGAPRRIGFRPESKIGILHNGGYERFLTTVVEQTTPIHEVHRASDIGLTVGVRVVERLSLSPKSAPEAKSDPVFARLASLGDSKPIVAMGVGAGLKKRVWPIARFREVAEWLVASHDAIVLVVGGPADSQLGDEIAASLGPRMISLLHPATIMVTYLALKECSLFIGNDSGPMHLAAAAGVPVIEISCHPKAADQRHANSPSRFAPWGVDHEILRPATAAPACAQFCRGRKPHCILGVTASDVCAATGRFLSVSAPTPSLDGIHARGEPGNSAGSIA